MYQKAQQNEFFYVRKYLTFGSNFNEFAVKYAARPSFSVIAKPPIKGEYSIDETYVLLSKIGTAKTIKQNQISKQLLGIKENIGLP